MENFIKLLTATFDDKKKISYLVDVLNQCKNNKANNNLYDFDFALAVGSNVIANKMDLDSVIIAILYCLSRAELYSLEGVTNEEYLQKINSLYTMSKLEMSTKSDEVFGLDVLGSYQCDLFINEDLKIDITNVRK